MTQALSPDTFDHLLAWAHSGQQPAGDSRDVAFTVWNYLTNLDGVDREHALTNYSWTEIYDRAGAAGAELDHWSTKVRLAHAR